MRWVNLFKDTKALSVIAILMGAVLVTGPGEAADVEPNVLPSGYGFDTAVSVGSEVFLLGGWKDGLYTDEIWSYDPDSLSFEKKDAKLPATRANGNAFQDGQYIYYVVGVGAPSAPIIIQYDWINDKAVGVVGNAAVPRSGTALSYDGSSAYVFGGWGGEGSCCEGASYSNKIYRFDPDEFSYTHVANLPTYRHHAAAAFDGEHHYVFGGKQWAADGPNRAERAQIREILRFDPTTNDVSSTGHFLDKPLQGLRAVSINGEMYIFGGTILPSETLSTSIYRYDGNSDPVRLDQTLDHGASDIAHAEWRSTIHVIGSNVQPRILQIIDPYEGLPRYTLGVNFSLTPVIDGLATTRPTTFELCEDDLVKVIQSYIFSSLDPSLMDELLQEYVDLKDWAESEFGAGWCFNGSLSMDLHGEKAGPGGLADAFVSGIGFHFPIGTGSYEKMFKIVRLLTAFSGSAASATVGAQYVLERGCFEQQFPIPAEVATTYGFAAEVTTVIANAGWTNAWVRFDMAPMAKGLSVNQPWNEDFVRGVSTWAAGSWVSQDSDATAEEPVWHNVEATPGTTSTYGRIAAGSANVGFFGTSVHDADAWSGDQGLNLKTVDVDFIDVTPPSLQLHPNGLQGRNEWFIGPVTLTALAADTETCINYFELEDAQGVTIVETTDPWSPRLSVELDEDGAYTVTAKALNFDGSWGEVDHEVRIDMTPPTSDIVSQNGTWRNGWSSTCVTLGFEAYDDTSGPAEILTDFEGDVIEGAEREHCAEGITRVSYWPFDVAGNQGAHRQTAGIAVDMTAPTSLPPVKEGDLGYEGWFQGCVDVTFVSTDAHPARQTSGVETNLYGVNTAELQEGNSTTVCDEGPNLLNYTARDKAGNTGPVLQGDVLIDNTPPSVGVDAPLNSDAFTSSADVDWIGVDALSGLYGPLTVEVREQPLVGSPSSFEEVCSPLVYANSETGTCTYEFPNSGRFCFRAHVADRAKNEAVSELSCTVNLGVL